MPPPSLGGPRPGRCAERAAAITMDVALLLSPEILEVGVLPQNHGQELPETPAPGAPAPSWAATSQLPHPRTQEGAHTGGARTDALLTLMGGCAHSPGLGGGPRAEPTCLWEVCGGEVPPWGSQ